MGSETAVETNVLVVGAGPTGLLLAAELCRRGVDCQLVDAQPGPMHWDRATVIHPRSLEVFESLGLVDQFLDAGCPQRGAKVYAAGELLGQSDLRGCGSRYEFHVGLSEEVTESILTEHLHRVGGDVTRSTRLIGLEQHDDGVLAELERDGQRLDIKADWIVGCDGFHGATRQAAGIGYAGHDIAEPWAVFDATLEGWSEPYDLSFVYLDAVPVIFTALPGKRWRVYLRPSTPTSDLLADASATLAPYAPQVAYVDVDNPVRFQCHSMIATPYRKGRVLVAGDAAHVCTPAEGHGMNTGLQDAFNVAWKLALVAGGHAQDTLLDSYQA